MTENLAKEDDISRIASALVECLRCEPWIAVGDDGTVGIEMNSKAGNKLWLDAEPGKVVRIYFKTKEGETWEVAATPREAPLDQETG